MRRVLILTTVVGMTTFLTNILTNVVSSQIKISLWVSWPLLIFLELVCLLGAALLQLQPSGKDIALGEGKAPISIWRGFAGVCFLLNWSFVILAAWSMPLTFSLFPDVGAAVLAVIYVIGIFVVLPASLGIYLIKKDYERYGKLELSGTRVLLLSLLVIFHVFVVTCIGVLSWMANMMMPEFPSYHFGGGCCSYPDIFINIVMTTRILALVVACVICVLHYVLFLLRKV